MTDPAGSRTWPYVLGAVVLTLAGLAAIWFLAAPGPGVCPAIYPAPPGCRTADRIPTALVASGGMVLASALAVLTLRTVARGRPGRSAATLLVLGLLGALLANVVWLA